MSSDKGSADDTLESASDDNGNSWNTNDEQELDQELASDAENEENASSGDHNNNDDEQPAQEPALDEEIEIPVSGDKNNNQDGQEMDQEQASDEENPSTDDDAHSWNTEDELDLDQELNLDANENVQDQGAQPPVVVPPEVVEAAALPPRNRGKFTDEEKRLFALGYHHEGNDWDKISRAYVKTRNVDQLKYYFRRHFNH